MKPLTGRQVLMIFLGFFGATFAVNGIMINEAITTFSGEVAPNTYLRGLNYNDTLEARARQHAEGWRAVIGASREAGGRVRVSMTVTGTDGAAIRGLALHGAMRLPATEGEDQRFILSETAAGRYEAVLSGLRPALWDIDISTPEPRADTETAPRFEARNRLWIR